MGVGPRTVVSAPLSVPSPVNLLTAGRTIDENDDRWENGFEFAPENCSGSGTSDPCNTEEERTIGTSPSSQAFQPFGVWAGDRCSPNQFQTRSWKDRARRLLEACLPHEAEREFWTGERSIAAGWGNPYLADGTSILLSEDTEPVDALACLERGLAECACGQRGMIHTTRDVVVRWSHAGLLRREGKLLLTDVDTIVVPGVGYPGTGPGDVPAAAGRSWAYATGIVEVRLGPVDIWPDELKEAMDHRLNMVEFRAERTVGLSWDQCCHLAVEVVVPDCQRLVS